MEENKTPLWRRLTYIVGTCVLLLIGVLILSGDKIWTNTEDSPIVRMDLTGSVENTTAPKVSTRFSSEAADDPNTLRSGVEGMRSNAIAYLLLYNFMFIVPLLIVFGCVYWGTTSVQLGGVLQRHLVSVKVAIGLLLFGLGIWLVLIII